MRARLRRGWPSSSSLSKFLESAQAKSEDPSRFTHVDPRPPFCTDFRFPESKIPFNVESEKQRQSLFLRREAKISSCVLSTSFQLDT